MRMAILGAAGLCVVCAAGLAYRSRTEDEEGPFAKAPQQALIGAWERTADDQKLLLNIEGNHLRITLTGKDAKPLYLFEADYGVTKDSILFGIVTSVEPLAPPVAGPGRAGPPGSGPTPGGPGVGGPPGLAPPAADLPLGAVGREVVAIDDLFSFRFRVDGDILTVKDVRLKGGPNKDSLLAGRFKKAADQRDAERGRREFEKRSYKDAAKDRFFDFKEKGDFSKDKK